MYMSGGDPNRDVVLARVPFWNCSGVFFPSMGFGYTSDKIALFHKFVSMFS